MGLGLIHLPATVAVSIYFNKKRAFASGVASCGSGIGTLIMAPIVTLLEKNFGWGYAMMMIGALMLVCVPLGLLFKPLAGDDAESLNLCIYLWGTLANSLLRAVIEKGAELCPLVC